MFGNPFDIWSPDEPPPRSRPSLPSSDQGQRARRRKPLIYFRPARGCSESGCSRLEDLFAVYAIFRRGGASGACEPAHRGMPVIRPVRAREVVDRQRASGGDRWPMGVFSAAGGKERKGRRQEGRWRDLGRREDNVGGQWPLVCARVRVVPSRTTNRPGRLHHRSATHIYSAAPRDRRPGHRPAAVPNATDDNNVPIRKTCSCRKNRHATTQGRAEKDHTADGCSTAAARQHKTRDRAPRQAPAVIAAVT